MMESTATMPSGEQFSPLINSLADPPLPESSVIGQIRVGINVSRIDAMPEVKESASARAAPRRSGARNDAPTVTHVLLSDVGRRLIVVAQLLAVIAIVAVTAEVASGVIFVSGYAVLVLALGSVGLYATAIQARRDFLKAIERETTAA